ncbi:MAG: hypothetical protein BGN88_07255 [Clostridiales bacterium 43-6]|nr:MAG: hypothetical protein BGN88_07255 [Clostridiales bacterium 43-6]
MDFDATSAGIEPGGLRTRSEIKLLICYILYSVRNPVSAENLAIIIAEDGLANYFEVNTSVNELKENGSLQTDENNELLLTQSGNEIARTLESALPFSVREKAVKSAMNMTSKVKREKENRVLIEKSEYGYSVTLLIMDSELELMSIRVLVSDSLQADIIKEEFLKNPTEVYKTTLEKLTGYTNN